MSNQIMDGHVYWPAVGMRKETSIGFSCDSDAVFSLTAAASVFNKIFSVG
jgi:hypothetical protein